MALLLVLLHPVIVRVLGLLAAVLVVSLHQQKGVTGLYFCPSGLATLSTMAPCVSSIEGPTPTLPNDDCCYVVRTTEPSCLCVAFAPYKNSPSINFKAAMTLPHNCGRQVATNFTCNGFRVPLNGLPPSRKLKL